MKNAKAKLAAAATVVALGGFTGLALSQGGEAPTKAVADKPAVRTKVVRRTIHVTKHAKPKHPPAAAPVEPQAAAAASGASVTTSSSGSASAETAPVTTSSSGSGESAPVTTSSSGSGGGEYEDVDYDDHGESGESGDDHGGEHEGGDD
ncbi:MAG TPA: hypothetical protein VFY75_01920 [Solirubrobacterales bacterium]|nr:hypothetical protein [Solirubrobacterales bacterium]